MFYVMVVIALLLFLSGLSSQNNNRYIQYIFLGIEIDDSLDHPFSVENAVTLSPYSVDGDTSPKPATKHTRYVSYNQGRRGESMLNSFQLDDVISIL